MNDTSRLTRYSNKGLVFDVTDTGPLDGEVVVLLHGWPLTMTCWEGVARQLNEQGFRTLAPNQRGYSTGARPKGRWSYRMSQLVGDVEALIQQLGGKAVHLVGHDWGAVVGWALASQKPELIKSLTSLSVPPTGAFLRSMLSVDQLLRVYYMGIFQLPLLPEWMMSRDDHTFVERLVETGLGQADAERLYQEIVVSGALEGSLNWYRAMPFTSPKSLFAKVSVPTIHIWGDADASLTRCGAELTEKFATGPYQLKIIAGGTHWLPLQEAEKVAQFIVESMAVAS